jgi:hypothetical protein
MKSILPPDTDTIRYLVHYSPSTGVFRSLVDYVKGPKVGDILGKPTKSGKLLIEIEGHSYLNDQLAFIYMTLFPMRRHHKIWHKNDDPGDCRWSNLMMAGENPASIDRLVRTTGVNLSAPDPTVEEMRELYENRIRAMILRAKKSKERCDL